MIEFLKKNNLYLKNHPVRVVFSWFLLCLLLDCFSPQAWGVNVSLPAERNQPSTLEPTYQGTQKNFISSSEYKIQTFQNNENNKKRMKEQEKIIMDKIKAKERAKKKR